MPEVKSIASKKGGRLLTKWTPKYRQALREAGPPVNVNIVLAAAEEVVTAVDRTLLMKNGETIELKLKCPWVQSLKR